MVFTDWETHKGVHGMFNILALSVDRTDGMNL